MAYIHCAKCDWLQDDFWSWKYNPLTKIWRDIKWLMIPKIIYLDDWIIKDITDYTGISVHIFEKRPTTQVSNDNELNGLRTIGRIDFYRKGVFSWQWLFVEIVKDLKVGREMKWWTFKQLKRDRKSCCPKCGLNIKGWWIIN